MARIRSIKPDFWDSADTARASLRTRLLYIAMWNWVDDYGVGDGHPGRIITFAFPNDDIAAADYPRLLADVSRAFGVVFFEYLGRPYFTIPAWEKHQRTEKKAKPKEGLLEAAAAAVESFVPPVQSTDPEPPQIVADSPTPSDGCSGAGSRKLEVGKGTGEGTDLPDPDGSSESDSLAHITETDFPNTFAAMYPDAFEQWWDHYPRKTGKRKAFEAWKKARKRATADELIEGARRYAADPNRTDQFTKYPEGWLNRDGWLDQPEPDRGVKRYADGQPLQGADLRAAENAQIAQLFSMNQKALDS